MNGERWNVEILAGCPRMDAPPSFPATSISWWLAPPCLWIGRLVILRSSEEKDMWFRCYQVTDEINETSRVEIVLTMHLVMFPPETLSNTNTSPFMFFQ